MQRWQRRLRFYHDSVLLDGLCPTLGVAGVIWLVVSGSDSLPAFGACAGAVGLRSVGWLADVLTRNREERR